jgi:hypothetical protein
MASTRSIVGNSPEPELVVEPGAHDVVAFVNSGRQAAGEGRAGARVGIPYGGALAAEVYIEVLDLQAPGGSELPLYAAAERPPDGRVGSLQRHIARRSASWAAPNRPDLGFPVGEATGGAVSKIAQFPIGDEKGKRVGSFGGFTSDLKDTSKA